MSKVLVDRELLERVEQWVQEDSTALEELQAVLAQPAEAEGVRDYLVEFAEGEIEARTAIEELLAALSAVTAERDRLRKDAERYRWLREMHQSPCGLTLTIARVGMMELTGWSGDDPDSVIDAAMAAKEA